jgi:hypothetical protein
MLTGAADFSVPGTLTDVGTAFTTSGIEVGSIIYNTGASAAYYVTEVVSDTVLSLFPSSAEGAADAYTAYTGGQNNGCVLYAGVAGNIEVATAGGDVVEFIGINAGTFLPVQVVRVALTPTAPAATDILALW